MTTGNFNPTLSRLCRVCLWLGVLFLLLGGNELAAANYVVRMQNTRFVPRDITISVGDSITWTNLDFTGHDATSGTNGTPNGFWRTPLFGFGGSATVTFTNFAPRSYGYYCTPHVFVGMVGSVTVLPANTPPTITILEPANGAVVPAGVSLDVLADPQDADGRVVRVDFSVDGAALSSDNFPPFQATYANPPPGSHILRVVAVDDRGATSAPVSVTITALLPPSIVQQPQSTNALEFDPVSFSVVATGAPPLQWQWQLNGTSILGATNATYFIASVRTNDAGSYSVNVSNPVGSVTSSSALLLVTSNSPPVVMLLSPTNGQPFANGASAEVVVSAFDTDGAITRVEFVSGGNVFAVVTNPPYSATLSNLDVNDRSYRLWARATDDRGATVESPRITIFVPLPPTIAIIAPTDQASVPRGQVVTVEYDTGRGRPPRSIELLINGFLQSSSNQFVPMATGWSTLTAIATDQVNQRGTSAPVNIRVYLPEDVPPSITVTSSPPNFVRLNDPRLTLAGTAQDDVGILRVEATNATSGAYLAGSGTERWMVELDLVAGVNTIQVRSVDQAFNPSPWVTRYFTYVVTSPLTVSMNGQGSVSPNLNGRLLEIGKTYRMTAKPGGKQIFASWDGAPYQGQVLDFVMQSNLVLTANFVPSPFTDVAGPYAGLIQDTNAFAPDGNGLLTLQVSESGAFSGRLRAAGRNHSFKGVFDHHGFGQAIVLRPSQTPFLLAMQLDWIEEGGTIRGSVTDGSWVSDLVCHRNPYATGTNLCPRIGNRSFLWRDNVQSAVVAGSSVNVSSRGQVKAAAMFVDGRKVSVGTSVSLYGNIPLAFSSGRFDSLLGWATVGLAGDLRVFGGGNLIPAGTNSLPATLTIQPLVLEWRRGFGQSKP